MPTIVSITTGSLASATALPACNAGDVIVVLAVDAGTTLALGTVQDSGLGTVFSFRGIATQQVSSAIQLQAWIGVARADGTPNLTVTMPVGHASGRFVAYVLRSTHYDPSGWVWTFTNVDPMTKTFDSLGVGGTWIGAYCTLNVDHYNAMGGGGTLDVRSVGALSAIGSLVVAAGAAITAGVDLTVAGTADVGMVLFMPETPLASGGIFDDRNRQRPSVLWHGATNTGGTRRNPWPLDASDFGLRDNVADNGARLN